MSTRVVIKLLDEKLWRDRPMFNNEAQKEFAKRLLATGSGFTLACVYGTNVVGEQAAEEAFDLTNNPSREEERQKVYGNGRSVSSGDIVEVDSVNYLCCSIGWERL